MKLPNINMGHLISAAIGWLLGSLIYAQFFNTPFDDSKYIERIMNAEKTKKEALVQRDLAIEARDEALDKADQEILIQNEIQSKQIENHNYHEKYINKHIVLADADSLLSTGKALSDSINRVGYFSTDSY